MKLFQKSVLGVLTGAMLTSSVYAGDEFIALPVFNDPTVQ